MDLLNRLPLHDRPGRMADAPLAEGKTRSGGWQRLPLDGPLPSLRLASVHIWLASLDDPPCPPALLDATLSAAEQRQAEAFVQPIHGRRYRTARGLLRLLLGGYLGRAAATLRFAYGPAGKPRLVDANEPDPLEFNLSHSADWVLIGVTRTGPIGVDLEARRPIPEHPELARQNFARGEIAALAALPPHDRLEGFFRCWTRKEAIIKAVGTGLSMPLDQFEVSVGRDDPRLLWIGGADAATFGLWSFDRLPSLTAALALYGRPSESIDVETYTAVRQ
jgi:4'-phosphopantetheinyl transferase